LRQLFKAIRSDGLRVSALSGDRSEATLLHYLESELTHQTKDPISATVDGVASQQLLEPPRAVSTSTLGKESRELFTELLVFSAPRALRLQSLSIKATATEPQSPTAFGAAIASRIVL
jgi:hypothetical protein